MSARGRLRRLRGRLGRLVFGDRTGLAVFLATVLFAAVTWRAGLFITDNATLRATLSAVSEGRLWLEPATGEYLQSPGTVVRDGFVYGRNYGQVVLALPVLWLFEALSAVADLRVALVAGWHLGALTLAVVVGDLLDRPWLGRVGGSVAVLGLFVANLLVVERFEGVSTALLALQGATILAAGLLALLTYRLVARHGGRRLGVLVGLAAVLVLPVGFWATIPKRHVLVSTLCLGVLFLFARSRTAEPTPVPVLGSVPARRAGMYGLVALLAWVHAAEGLFVFLAVLALDLPTAPSNDRRTLALVTGTFLLALLPMALTNLAVSGSPVEPPRALSGGFRLDSGTAGGGAGGSGGVAGESPLARVWDVPLVGGALWLADTTYGIAAAGVGGLLDPGAVYHTFVRSTPVSGEDLRFRGVNLTVLEAAPVLGTLAGVAGVAVTTRLRRLSRPVSEPVSATTLLGAALAAAFVLVYAERLPLRVQLTMRYLLPVYPLVLVLLARSRVVRAVLTDHTRTLLWTYAAGVLVGTQLVFVATSVRGLAVAEAARFHALCGLGLAGLVAVAVTASAVDERSRPLAAVALGLAAAAGTVFVLLAGLDYFAFTGQHLLPVVELVADALALA